MKIEKTPFHFDSPLSLTIYPNLLSLSLSLSNPLSTLYLKSLNPKSLPRRPPPPLSPLALPRHCRPDLADEVVEQLGCAASEVPPPGGEVVDSVHLGGGELGAHPGLGGDEGGEAEAGEEAGEEVGGRGVDEGGAVDGHGGDEDEGGGGQAGPLEVAGAAHVEPGEDCAGDGGDAGIADFGEARLRMMGRRGGTTKVETKQYKCEEVKIQAWENHEKRKTEMEMKRIEDEKLSKKPRIKKGSTSMIESDIFCRINPELFHYIFKFLSSEVWPHD